MEYPLAANVPTTPRLPAEGPSWELCRKPMWVLQPGNGRRSRVWSSTIASRHHVIHLLGAGRGLLHERCEHKRNCLMGEARSNCNRKLNPRLNNCTESKTFTWRWWPHVRAESFSRHEAAAAPPVAVSDALADKLELRRATYQQFACSACVLQPPVLLLLQLTLGTQVTTARTVCGLAAAHTCGVSRC